MFPFLQPLEATGTCCFDCLYLILPMGNVGHWHTRNKLGLLLQPSVTLQLEGRVLLAGRLQSKAEDSGVFDSNCVLQLPPVNRYPWAPRSPGCSHLIMLCCYRSIPVKRTHSRLSASVTMHQG